MNDLWFSQLMDNKLSCWEVMLVFTLSYGNHHTEKMLIKICLNFLILAKICFQLPNVIIVVGTKDEKTKKQI